MTEGYFSLLLILIFFRRLQSVAISDGDVIPLCPAHLRHSSFDGELQETYDIVVIGAGAAGSLLSSELAKMLDVRVLLVEAGVETGNADNPNITDPALWLNVLHNASLEWHFNTVPQTALDNRTIDLGFAKGTGGSAMHNAMGYVRGGRAWSVTTTTKTLALPSARRHFLTLHLGWTRGRRTKVVRAGMPRR